MTFFNCLADAMDEGSADRARGARAQALWTELRDKYRRQGHPDDMADALAAQDVKAAFKREAGEKRHVFLATVGVMRKREASVNSAKDLGTLATSQVEYMSHRPNAAASIVGQSHALRRQFHYRLSDLIQKHHRNLLGNNKDLPGLLNVVRELHGKSTGDLAALAVAKGVQDAFKEMRRMFNEAGGIIGDLDDWGLQHVHDKLAIIKAGFDRWYGDVKNQVAWHRIEDNLTGRPLAAEGANPSEATMREFLRGMYDNLAFGRGSDEAVYGIPRGENLVKKTGRERVLHFKDADGWIAYNKTYGSGDIYGSIIAHGRKMSEDIVALREFGPSPDMMMQYQEQLAVKKARDMGDEGLAERIVGNHEHARRMLRLQRGGTQPHTLTQATVARFFSSARQVIQSALLDRAIISSVSDLNTSRMAAKSVGMDQFGPTKRHMDLLFNGASRAQLARAGWIADTLADPGLMLARWSAEVPPAALAERLSSGVMRAQGLAHWTDQGRHAFQFEMAGYLADNAGRLLADIPEPLGSLLRETGLTEGEWAAFSNPAHMFTADNGATFASPMWWREHTDIDPSRADDIYLKVQTLIEEQTEFAVPTQSLWARAGIEADDIPGTIGYELKKSALMIKSFQMTFTVNQVSRIMSKQGLKARAGYAFDLAAGATILGAVALQASEMLYGRDPQDMTDPSFWGRAILKGGGFGVIGDLVAAGESSWGGGFGSFLSGPAPKVLGDVWNLSVGNAVELITGEDTHFGRDLVKFLDRYTPGADIPIAGVALDRLLWDSLQKLLDPEAENAMLEAATKRRNLYGNASWWMPGSPTPSRAPNPGAALGQ